MNIGLLVFGTKGAGAVKGTVRAGAEAADVAVTGGRLAALMQTGKIAVSTRLATVAELHVLTAARFADYAASLTGPRVALAGIGHDATARDLFTMHHESTPTGTESPVGSPGEHATSHDRPAHSAPWESLSAPERARVEELARDPAHGGQVSAKSMEEGWVGFNVEEGGLLKGPLRRDPTGAAEFIDRNNQAWDVKSYRSDYPTGYNYDEAMDKIREELNLGENVILNTTHLTAEAVAELRAGVEAVGWRGKVVFWP